MNLNDLRNNIDTIDSKLVKLIADRLRIAAKIGEEKKKQSNHIEDRTREAQVLNNVQRIAEEEGIRDEDIKSIYRLIMSLSKNKQGVEVAFQGEVGAYSEEAAFSFFGPSIQTRAYETLGEVFTAVLEHVQQYGIVPIENSTEGSINRTYDLLLESDVKVYGEYELKIAYCLIANDDAELDSIKKIYSHPQVLAQCHYFLKKLGCELIPVYDTTVNIKMIKEQKIRDEAVITNLRVADIYDMKIIEQDIQDNKNNFTRFFVIAIQDSPSTGDDKTSIVFQLNHMQGTLDGFLKEFGRRKINLTKIESRPIKHRPWEYHFYLDFEGHRGNPNIQKTLDKLKSRSVFLKVLGSYPMNPKGRVPRAEPVGE